MIKHNQNKVATVLVMKEQDTSRILHDSSDSKANQSNFDTRIYNHFKINKTNRPN